LDRLERKKRLNNACLHVEDPGAVGSAAGDAEGHFRQSTCSIDRIVMAEHENLTGELRQILTVSHAQMVPAVFLGNAAGARATRPPLSSDDAATTVRSSLFQAGRFAGHEAP